MICTYQDHADEDEPEMDTNDGVVASSSSSKVITTGTGASVTIEHHNHELHHQQSSSSSNNPEQIIFPAKLHNMLDHVEKEGLSHVVGWAPHGRCFIVRNKHEFVSHVLATWFRQSKFASFQRQLNLYGFKRITTGPDKGGYYHELFLRGKLFLCHRIERIKIKGSKPGRIKAYADAEPDFYKMRPLPENEHYHHHHHNDAARSHDHEQQQQRVASSSSVVVLGGGVGTTVHQGNPNHPRRSQTADAIIAPVSSTPVPIAPAIASSPTSQAKVQAPDAMREMNLDLSASFTGTHPLGRGRQISFLSGPGPQPVSLARSSRHSPPIAIAAQEDAKADSSASPTRDDIARRLATIVPHKTTHNTQVAAGSGGGLSAFGGLRLPNNDDSSPRNSATTTRTTTTSSHGNASSMFNGGGGGNGIISTNVHPMLQASGRTNLINLRRNSAAGSSIFDANSQAAVSSSKSESSNLGDQGRGLQRPMIQSFLSQPTLPQQVLMPASSTTTTTNLSSSTVMSNPFGGRTSTFASPSSSVPQQPPPQQQQQQHLHQQGLQHQHHLSDTQIPMLNLPNEVLLSQSLPTAEALALEDLFDHVDAATMAAAIGQGGSSINNLLLQEQQPPPQQQPQEQGIIAGCLTSTTTAAPAGGFDSASLPSHQQVPLLLLPGRHHPTVDTNAFGDASTPTTRASGGAVEEGRSGSDGPTSGS